MIDIHNCPHCQRPLIEIDHYGERLIGCIECNRWGWLGSGKPFMALPEEISKPWAISLTRATKPKTLPPKSGSTEH